MHKSVLITFDGPSFEAALFNAVDKAIRLNYPSLSSPTPDAAPYGDFKWLVSICSGIPTSTLRIKSASGEIPGVVKFGKRVLYQKATVLSWLHSQTRNSANLHQIEQASDDGFNHQHQRVKGGQPV